MLPPTPLDPEGTAWLAVDGDGLCHLMVGPDPDAPNEKAVLTADELRVAAAAIHAV